MVEVAPLYLLPTARSGLLSKENGLRLHEMIDQHSEYSNITHSNQKLDEPTYISSSDSAVSKCCSDNFSVTCRNNSDYQI